MLHRPMILLSGAVAALALAGAALAQPTIERSVKVAPGGLYELVFNPTDSNLYVAAAGPRGADQSVIARVNTPSLGAEGLIDVAANPLYGLALNSRTQTLYGANTLGGEVSAIDLSTGRVIASIRSDREKAHLRQLVVDEDSNRIYVSEVGGRGSNTDTSRIWIINGADNSIARLIEVDAVLTGLAIDTVGQRAFSTDMVANEVVVVDLETGATLHRWPTGGENTINVAYDADNGRLFATNQGSGELSVMNAEDGAVVHKIATGEGALSVDFNPAVNQIYVANRRAGTVTVLDGATYAVLANLETGTFPQSIAIDRATGAVYVSNKARGLPRNAPAGTPVPDDPNGDTISLIRP